MSAATRPAAGSEGRLSAPAWLALGVLGTIMFGVVVASIFLPLLGRLPFPAFTPYGLSIAGGALLYYSFYRYYDLRHPRPRRPREPGKRAPITESSTFEVYNPRSR